MKRCSTLRRCYKKFQKTRKRARVESQSSRLQKNFHLWCSRQLELDIKQNELHLLVIVAFLLILQPSTPAASESTCSLSRTSSAHEQRIRYPSAARRRVQQRRTPASTSIKWDKNTHVCVCVCVCVFVCVYCMKMSKLLSIQNIKHQTQIIFLKKTRY